VRFVWRHAGWMYLYLSSLRPDAHLKVSRAQDEFLRSRLGCPFFYNSRLIIMFPMPDNRTINSVATPAPAAFKSIGRKAVLLTTFALLLSGIPVRAQTFLGSIVEKLGGKPYIQQKYLQNKKTVAFVAAQIPETEVGMALVFDLSDAAGITKEGQEGWVTVWVDFQAGISIREFKEFWPFDIGVENRDFNPYFPDDPISMMEFSAQVDLAVIGIDAFTIGSAGTSDAFDVSLGASSLLEISAGLTYHGFSFECKIESLNKVLGEIAGSGMLKEQFALKLISLFAMPPFMLVAPGTSPFIKYRITTSEDDPDFSFIAGFDSQRLVEGQPGLLRVRVLTPETGNYYMRVWDGDSPMLPPRTWEWQSTQTEIKSLSIGEHDFLFDVTPDSQNGHFVFWLYQQSDWPGGLDLYREIAKIEAYIHASPPGSDIVEPYVSFTGPKSGALIQNNTVISLVAGDNGIGLGRVELFVNGSHAITKYDAPFEFRATDLGIPAGQVELTARAYDVAGNWLDDALTLYKDPDATSIYDGKVNPPIGTTDDEFVFSVRYKSSSGTPPDGISVTIDGVAYPMTPGGSDWQNGVTCSYRSKFERGIHQFFFSGEANDQPLPTYPISSTMSFAVNRSYAGWDIQVNDAEASPEHLTAYSPVRFEAGVYNGSASGNTYYDVPYVFTLHDESGDEVAVRAGTISQLLPGDETTVSCEMTPRSPDDAFNCVFVLYPDQDSDYQNNTLDVPVAVGGDGPEVQYHLDKIEVTVNEGQSYVYKGRTYKLIDIDTRDNEATIQQNSGSYKNIEVDEFFEFPGGQIVLVDAISNIGGSTALLTFGYRDEKIVEFPRTNFTGFPKSPISFEASSDVKLTTSVRIYDGQKNGFDVDDWIMDADLTGNEYAIKYTGIIDREAPADDYPFWLAMKLADNTYTMRELEITVLPPPPRLKRITTTTISADDIIMLLGDYFDKPGSVHFNDLPGEIISWNEGDIQVRVPEGVQSGFVAVTTDHGTSAGIQYTVISPTGAPSAVQEIPDFQFIPGVTTDSLVLSEFFSDPNGDALKYVVTFGGLSLAYDTALLEDHGILKIVDGAGEPASTTVTIAAEDTGGKTAVMTIEVLVPDKPTVETLLLSSWTSGLYTIAGGGTVHADGGVPVFARGLCLSEDNPEPTIDDPHIDEGTGTGSFSLKIPSLDHSTSYYVRSYAANLMGVSYGNVVQVRTKTPNSIPRPDIIFPGQRDTVVRDESGNLAIFSSPAGPVDVDGDQLSKSVVLANVDTDSIILSYLVSNEESLIFPAASIRGRQSYTIRLWLTDGIDTSSVASCTFYISNSLPAASLLTPQAGDVIGFNNGLFEITPVNGDPIDVDGDSLFREFQIVDPDENEIVTFWTGTNSERSFLDRARLKPHETYLLKSFLTDRFDTTEVAVPFSTPNALPAHSIVYPRDSVVINYDPADVMTVLTTPDGLLDADGDTLRLTLTIWSAGDTIQIFDIPNDSSISIHKQQLSPHQMYFLQTRLTDGIDTLVEEVQFFTPNTPPQHHITFPVDNTTIEFDSTGRCAIVTSPAGLFDEDGDSLFKIITVRQGNDTVKTVMVSNDSIVFLDQTELKGHTTYTLTSLLSDGIDTDLAEVVFTTPNSLPSHAIEYPTDGTTIRWNENDSLAVLTTVMDRVDADDDTLYHIVTVSDSVGVRLTRHSRNDRAIFIGRLDLKGHRQYTLTSQLTDRIDTSSTSVIFSTPNYLPAHQITRPIDNSIAEYKNDSVEIKTTPDGNQDDDDDPLTKSVFVYRDTILVKAITGPNDAIILLLKSELSPHTSYKIVSTLSDQIDSVTHSLVFQTPNALDQIKIKSPADQGFASYEDDRLFFVTSPTGILDDDGETLKRTIILTGPDLEFSVTKPNNIPISITSDQLVPGTNYTVEAILSDGFETTSDTVVFMAPVMTSGETTSAGVRIYPNPFGHELTIESDNRVLIRVIDNLGRTVVISHVNDKTTIPINTAPGLYLIKVRDGRAETFFKMLKEK